MTGEDKDGGEATKGFHFPPPSTRVTEPCWILLSDYTKIIDLFFFLVRLADRADKVVLVAAKALIVGAEEGERMRHQKVIDNPTLVSDRLKEFSYLNSKNLTLNIVDAFLWYLSTILQEAMKRRPQMVKSKEKIEIETVFDFRSRKELINFLIDRKINSLSYSGVAGLRDFFRNSLGVELFPNARAEQLVQVFIEIRNIQIHNRGIVNATFLRRTSEQKEFSFKSGKVAHLDFDELVTLSKICLETALNLDRLIAGKFGIQSRRIATWRSKAKK